MLSAIAQAVFMLPKVMIVEDDPALREIYSLKFKLEGYRVCEAENGRHALDQLESFKPDVILLDLMMPVMGGVEFMQHFRTRGSAADIIVFSNFSTPEHAKSAYSLGAVDYWIKADHTPELVTRRVRQLWRDRNNDKGPVTPKSTG
jgi:two-component system response regulator (stage 0 sporulation protein F)